MSIKRFNCTARDKRGENGDCMEKSESGKYVLFSSHANEVKQLESKIKRLENKLSSYQLGANVATNGH
ncbi:TPA: hypothetical protein PMB21_001493 [Vibrio cholerae]|nr:hypothetical protein [Vibrio cholerae]